MKASSLDLVAEIGDPLFIGNFAGFFSCKPSDILVSEFYYADETAPRREIACRIFAYNTLHFYDNYTKEFFLIQRTDSSNCFFNALYSVLLCDLSGNIWFCISKGITGAQVTDPLDFDVDVIPSYEA